MNSRAVAKQISSPFLISDIIKNFRPLGVYFVRNHWALAVGLLSLLLVDFFQLIIPLVMKKTIDLLVTQTTETGPLLLKQGMIILAIALIRLVSLCVAVPDTRPFETGSTGAEEPDVRASPTLSGRPDMPHPWRLCGN